MRYLLFVAAILALNCSSPSGENAPKTDHSLLQYVNPLIGTAANATKSAQRHGKGTEENAQVVPMVTYPFAMTNWTPQTQFYEKRCLAPYYYRDTVMHGFRGTHWLSGSCVQDYGSFTVMPLSGELVTTEEARASAFSHDEEVASPAYYSVALERYGIQAELTATTRAGLLRFTFEQPEDAYVLINPNSDEAEGFVEIDVEKQEIRGYNPVHRIYQGWGESAGFSGYFVATFDQPFEQFGTYQNETVQSGATLVQNQENIGAFVHFPNLENPVVTVKIGTSFTSLDNARQNLETEVGEKDFDDIRTETEAVWEDALRKVEVTGSEDNKTIFYTAMYHSLLHPRLFSDVSGDYPSFAADTTVRTNPDFDYYDDFPMWDLYRAQLPLLHILYPEKTRSMAQSIVLKAEQGEWLPIFPCWNSYTAAMIGDHCVSFLSDAYAKGVRDFDVEKAYQYMRQNAFEQPENFEDYENGQGRRALDSYLKYNYIPMEDPVNEAFHKQEQVSRTLEYAYDDFALAQFAKALGKTDDYETLMQRAMNYQNVYDPSVGYVRGRHADGSWAEAFDPSGKMKYITEGTPRQYTWYVPQDVQGLINLMGGRENFVSKLDSMFTYDFYWHGNEPGHQTVYMYNYAGYPAGTQKFVRQIMADEYDLGPGGLSGNDDAGQMSAWYVFSAAGFYPVCPGTDEYVLGSPLFEEVHWRLGEQDFVIKANNNSAENKYIQSATLNGQPFERTFLRHQELLKGGTLIFEMGNAPSDWGTSKDAVPFSISK